MPLNVALAQIDLALGDSEANLRTAQQVVADAAAGGAQLVVLPELWGSGYDLEHANHLSDELNTGLFAAVAALARHHSVAISGSLLEWDAALEQPFNTAFLYDAQGMLRGSYRKIHRFGLMHEDQWLGGGELTPLLKTPWAPTALAICYDLRFPELFRRYAVDGAQLVIVPAEWPVQRIEHWRTLVRARAIENQCFIVACNRVGSDGANTFGGRSAVIDPWGSVLAEADDQPGLIIATLDWDAVEDARARLPALQDRRPEIYKLDR